MCSPQHCDLIQEVADEFVNDDKAFTAFEVSLEVQKRADAQSLPRERHRNMRGEIHKTLQQFVDSGVYSQTLVDVGAPSRAFLYYPPSYDPTDYVPLDRKDKPQAATPQPAASGVASSPSTSSTPPRADYVSSGSGLSSAVSDDDDEGDEQDTTGKMGDARGTVAVSAQVLRAAGFHKDDVAYACPNVRNGENVLVLAKQVPAGLSKQTSYTVDHGNNIRVTSYTLDKAGLDGSKGYDFERDGDQVIVKAHS